MSLPAAPDTASPLRARGVSADGVCPCWCGARPLAPWHRLQARGNAACAARVADVLLMHQLIRELLRPVPPDPAKPHPLVPPFEVA